MRKPDELESNEVPSEQEREFTMSAISGWKLKDADAQRKYLALVIMVLNAKPTLMYEEAVSKIGDAERTFGYQLYGTTYPTESNRQLVIERNKLSVFAALGLLSPEEKPKLDKLREDFEQITREVTEKTGDDREMVRKELDSVILSNVARNISEGKEILLEGPIITGFEETEDPRMPNSFVRENLQQIFGRDQLRRERIGRISKDDSFLMFRAFQGPHSSQHIKEGNELLEQGLARWGIESGGNLVAENRETYLQAEMRLEGVTNAHELKHIYKIRAASGDVGGFWRVYIRGFGTEEPRDFDYLNGIELDSRENLMRAYILGTVVHEVAHRFDRELSPESFEDYQKILEEETMPWRKKYVSDYVVNHDEVYKSAPRQILREDFAEAMRIYTTNPTYLEKNYPRRFAFIQANFPFIKAGGVVEAIKQLPTDSPPPAPAATE